MTTARRRLLRLLLQPTVPRQPPLPATPTRLPRAAPLLAAMRLQMAQALQPLPRRLLRTPALPLQAPPLPPRLLLHPLLPPSLLLHPPRPPPRRRWATA